MNLARRITLLGGAAVLASGFAVALPAEPAAAHGGFTFPATRTYACYQDGLEGGSGGGLNPQNPMCQEALEYSSYPFWNWFGNLISDAGDRHREIIPNGKLCGPTEQFDAFNRPGDWPATEVQSGDTVTFEHNAWARHPGTFTQYITKDGWDPSQPLGWDDLEPAPFDEVTDPPLRDGGVEGSEYYWQATLPEKSGRHVIYSIWERSDSPEAFYNCSDVVFGGDTGGGEDDTQAPTAPGAPSAGAVTGGSAELSWSAASDNVGVTGYEVHDAATGEVVATASGGTSATVTGLQAETSYSFYVVALDAAGNASSPSPEASVTTGSGGGGGPAECTVDYSIANAWSGGYTADVSVTNEGDTALDDWSVAWDFADGSTVTNGWSAEFAQEGTRVTASNTDWNGDVAAGSSVSFGFNSETSGTAAEPTEFEVNGETCTAS
ncbi:lytic polysaccharide monooxygenase [Streptomonospora wellingtoniae]|uniref:Lytic polysaccharide monooxygenase n=1 Tax=Streptomonospora wellingtoniae TaxID=3075544 RepID=A0ABU2KT15_9ACTN|nr:lytic polysaccharide monooxygenase [Streptomonospora sp. DSM 45055]MDT0302431.1 lytic polysaccharide monooxygenase [Streptomonospora sp. DSM 45055]